MLNLINNELLKIFKRPGTFVMIGLLLLIIIVSGAFVKYQDSKVTIPDNADWKQGLIEENKNYQSQIKEMGEDSSNQAVAFFKKEIALNEYRIEHNLSPNDDEYSVWGFVTDSAQMIELVGLFTIIIAAGIVASEFTWGTIKLLLIRPISRGKILLSKYLTVIIFALLLLFILFGFSALLGAILFGAPDKAIPYLNYYNGKVTEQSMIVHLITYYGLQSINMIMLATMAFMISAVFRNSSLAIGLALFLMFTGGQLTRLIASKYEWAKYILFANTNLVQYFEGAPVVAGMTIGFSITMLLIYFFLFQGLAFYIFKKRDVAA